MEIRYSKRFGKQLGRLRQQERVKFAVRVELWVHNSSDPIVHVHALTGAYTGFYSLNVTGDLRALYKIVDDKLVLFEFIGTHSQLYG